MLTAPVEGLAREEQGTLLQEARRCRCSQLQDHLWQNEDTAIKLLLFSQLLWQVLSPKRGRWRRYRRFEEKRRYQGHCYYNCKEAIGNTGKCELETYRGVCEGLVPI